MADGQVIIDDNGSGTRPVRGTALPLAGGGTVTIQAHDPSSNPTPTPMPELRVPLVHRIPNVNIESVQITGPPVPVPPILSPKVVIVSGTVWAPGASRQAALIIFNVGNNVLVVASEALAETSAASHIYTPQYPSSIDNINIDGTQFSYAGHTSALNVTIAYQ
ncbi:MAG: hypothetical protein JO323_13470 [Acidobacteriia bacterium]|nr:hypothetical protein [Terriglobia bacterium]